VDVWKLGMDAVEATYRLTSRLPDREKHGLCSQLQRAMVSAPVSMAEGHSRDTTKQYLFHVSVALNSLAEAETYLALCDRLQYGERSIIAESLERCGHLGRMFHNLQRKLKAKVDVP